MPSSHAVQSNRALSLGATVKSYTTGQVVGVATKIPNAFNQPGGSGILESLCLIDKENKKIAVDLYFFQVQPTSHGADGANFALSAAEAALLCCRVSVASVDYTSSTIVGEATKGNLFLAVAGQRGDQSPSKLAGQGSKDLWVVAVARGALTFASADSLYLRAGIVQD